MSTFMCKERDRKYDWKIELFIMHEMETCKVCRLSYKETSR